MNTLYENLLEAILFASGDAVKAERIADVAGCSVKDVYDTAARLSEAYEFDNRGIRLIRLENSLQLVSNPEFADVIRRALEARKQPKLSPAALEVLAIIAHEQPITRQKIDVIRGVDSQYTLSTLVERGLAAPCGRLENTPGRPVIYAVTELFLRSAGISSVDELRNFKEQDGSNQLSLELE
jgi:segregation and condensation protein B